MLYQIGPISLDTFPFSADRMGRSGSADLPAKPVIGGRKPLEFTGPGDDKITLSGQLLPTKIGGLTELEMAMSLMNQGTRLPVVRGDGRSLGWFAIGSVNENHSNLTRSGVGFTVTYSIELIRDTGAAASKDGPGIVSMLLSLFEGL